MTPGRWRRGVAVLACFSVLAGCAVVERAATAAGRALPVGSNPGRSYDRWTTPVPGWPFAVAADGAGAVAIGGQDAVLALDLADGQERWRTVVDGATIYAPALDRELVVVSARERFVGLDRATGALRWEVPIDDEATAVVLTRVESSVVALAATLGGRVLAIDATTGVVRWWVRHPGAVHAPAAVDPARGLAAMTWHDADEPRVRALELATGTLRWEAAIGVSSSGPITHDGVVVVGEGDARWSARIVGRDLATGEERWSIPAMASFEPSLVPVARGGEVAVSDHFGTVTLAGIADGRVRWQVATDEPILRSTMVMSRRAVVLTTHGGLLLVLDRRSGRLLEHEHPGGFPVGIALARGRLVAALRLTEPGRVEARPAP